MLIHSSYPPFLYSRCHAFLRPRRLVTGEVTHSRLAPYWTRFSRCAKSNFKQKDLGEDEPRPIKGSPRRRLSPALRNRVEVGL